jgi:UDP-hydrolysing UDP-N-acetyl-D-glucosamine 2-epimerase
MTNSRKRRICFPITSRAYYGRSQLLIRKLHQHPSIDLELMLGGSILLDKYSRHVADDIKEGGFTISASLFNVIEGGNHVAMAKTACLTALEVTNSLYTADPDVVVICGDRFEQLAIAMSAAYLNKTIAHIEGGDLTGSIDESVRHAITKLAHIHFVTNDDAKRRVMAMGEDPKYVFNTGSLDVERAACVDADITTAELSGYGVGHDVDVTRPFLTVIQHPVTTESSNRQHLETTFRALATLDVPIVWFWPNPDAGTGEMAETLRHFREHHEAATERMRFITNVPADQFVALLKRTACVVGNSSAGIKECSFLGTPVVDIGGRQQGRLSAENVVRTDYDADEVRAAVKRQLSHGRYDPSHIYFKPNASQSMVDVLTSIELYTQKRFHESVPEVS